MRLNVHAVCRSLPLPSRSTAQRPSFHSSTDRREMRGDAAVQRRRVGERGLDRPSRGTSVPLHWSAHWSSAEGAAQTNRLALGCACARPQKFHHELPGCYDVKYVHYIHHVRNASVIVTVMHHGNHPKFGHQKTEMWLNLLGVLAPRGRAGRFLEPALPTVCH
jgi:hypothetical protein